MANKNARPPVSNIVPGPIKRSRTNLAIMLRDGLHEKLILNWILIGLQGHNPVLVVDASATTTGGLRVTYDDSLGEVKLTFEQRLKLLELALARRDGMPAQHIHLEAEVRAELALGAGGVPKQEIAALDADKLLKLRELIRGPAALPEPAEDAEFVDVVDAVEDPNKNK